MSPGAPALDRPLELGSLGAFRHHLEDRRRQGATVGLVPTMGALHEGHRCLVERARAECSVVAVTIFVNPLQFDDPLDAASYPAERDQDLERLASWGVDVVLAPEVQEVYPAGPSKVQTRVSVPGLAQRFEGECRPGHFDGVATIVTKLFALAGPCRAYFGEKDFQQLALVRQLASDLSLGVEVVGCPTVREPDGLACSSRNRRLGPTERAAAAVVPAALAAGRRAAGAGATPGEVAAAVAAQVATEPAASLDYAAVVDAGTLEPLVTFTPDRPARLLVAARVGEVRLIDNDAIGPPGPGA